MLGGVESSERPLSSISTGTLSSLWVFAALCFAMLAVAVGFQLITGVDRQFYVLGSLMLAGIFGFLAYNAKISRIEIWPDRVEISNAIWTREFRSVDIIGYRQSLLRGKSVLRLKKSGREKTRRIPSTLAINPAVAEFLNRIPNLDAALESDASLGDSVEARRDRVRAIRWRTVYLNIPGYLIVVSWLVIMLLGNIHSRFWQIAVTAWLVGAIAAPILAIAASFAGRKLPLLSLRQDDPGASIMPLVASSALLALSAIADVNILDWDKTLIYSAGVAALLILLLVAVDQRMRSWGALSGVALLFGFYAYGTLTETNTILDRGQPQVFHGKLIAKHKHDRTYSVTVEPWGPFPQRGDIHVFEETYANVRAGQKVDIYLCPGLYGIRYYDVGSC